MSTSRVVRIRAETERAVRSLQTRLNDTFDSLIWQLLLERKAWIEGRITRPMAEHIPMDMPGPVHSAETSNEMSNELSDEMSDEDLIEVKDVKDDEDLIDD